jgi:hypothetical protein
MLSNHHHQREGFLRTSLCEIVELIAVSFRAGLRFVGIEVMVQVAHTEYWRVAVARHQARSRTVHEDLVVYIGCRTCEDKR